MRPLVLDDKSRQEIRRVCTFANLRRISSADLLHILGDRVPPPGDDPERRCVVPVGYRCAFTIEQQPVADPNDEQWCRHLSVSVIGEGKMPNEVAVAMLAIEFGFRFPDWQPGQDVERAFKSVDSVSFEDLASNKFAVNLIQRLEKAA